jgi:hypothetical protein
VRAYLAILSAEGCELFLHRYGNIEEFNRGSPSNHRVFSCPVEIFRISIRVTSPSIYGNEQGFRIRKESI